MLSPNGLKSMNRRARNDRTGDRRDAEDFLLYHGLPHRLVTDNGPQFTSHDFQDFMKANSIKHQCTPPYHPASNGQAERFVRELKKSLKGRPQGRSVSHQV